MEDEYVLLSHAAKVTGFSAEWLRKLVIAGELDGKKIGDQYWVITAEAFEQLKVRERQKRGWPKGKPRPRKLAD